MAWPSQFVSLVVGVTSGGTPKVAAVKRATAEYFGWNRHFDDYPDWVRKTRPQAPGGGYHFSPAIARGVGGRRHHIYLPEANWSTKGIKRVAFRIGRNVTKKDLAELVHFTGVDWYGVKEIGGTYWSRQELERLYQGT